jgi:hypothetical protein
MKSGKAIFVSLLGLFIAGLAVVQARAEIAPEARKVIDRAIQEMGGDAYLNMNSTSSTGRYFMFRKGRKAFTEYSDWTVYNPVKWRFQMGEGKRQFVQIYNLESNEGWTLNGKTDVEEMKPEDVEQFKKGVGLDVDVLLRYRLDEEGMNAYYYGPADIAGTGTFEAVEFLDATNNSVVVFFNTKTGLPEKLESHFTDKAGVRHKREHEYYNWHMIQGVNLPLRHDIYVDEEVSEQQFVVDITVNPDLPDSLFTRPVVEEK